MASLLDQVRGVSSFLEQVPDARRQEAASRQVQNLKAKIQNSSVTLPQCTDLMRAINSIQLEDAQRDILCSAVLEKAHALKESSSSRRDNQSWENCWKKIPQTVWNSWIAEGLQPSEVLEKIIVFFHSKGLRLPSEPTFGCIVALQLAAMGNTDVSKAQKISMVWDAKRMWSSMYRRPLPVDAWYHFYDEVQFPEGTSMAEFDQGGMLKLHDSIPLRTSNGCVAQTKPSKAAPLQLDLKESRSEIQGIAEVFGSALKAMQETQLLTLQTMQAGQFQGRGQIFQGASRNSLTLGGSYASKNSHGLQHLQIAQNLRPRAPGIASSSRASGGVSHALVLQDAERPEQAGQLAAEPPAEDCFEAVEEQTEENGQSEVCCSKPSGRMTLAQATAQLLGTGKVKREKQGAATQAPPDQKEGSQGAPRRKKTKGKNKKRKAPKVLLPATEPSTPPKRGKAGDCKAARSKANAKVKADETPMADAVSIATATAKADKTPRARAPKAKATPQKEKAPQKTGPKPSPEEKAAATTIALKTKLWLKYGCSKCRYKAGCTTSCWTYRGMIQPRMR